MSTVSPGSHLFHQETARVLSDNFHDSNDEIQTKIPEARPNSSNPKTILAIEPPIITPDMPGELPHKNSIDTIPACHEGDDLNTVHTNNDVDMASFFSIDNLEISEDKDGKTMVDGVSFSPVEQTDKPKSESLPSKQPVETQKEIQNDSLCTPQKVRAKSEALDTQVQKPTLKPYPTSAPHSPGRAQNNTPTRPPSINPSTVHPINGSSSEALKGTQNETRRVSAYARLDFPSFTFYVQTLQVILGRRPENGASIVDVDLGEAKAISRRHAKIYYNFGTQRFEMSVLGRNGAFVDDTFIDTGTAVPLKDGTKIQIGQISFSFILPSTSVSSEDKALPFKQEDATQESLPEISSPTGTQKTDTRSPSLVITDPDNLSSANLESSKPKRKSIHREYLPEEIPEEYREKPQFPYSHLIATALRAHPDARGISLSEIYKSIQDIFPYYQYCPHSWKHSVRHNLSSNKAFQKVSKEGKGWLWGIDEEYFQEREKRKAANVNVKVKPKPKQEHFTPNPPPQQDLKNISLPTLKQEEIPIPDSVSVSVPENPVPLPEISINSPTKSTIVQTEKYQPIRPLTEDLDMPAPIKVERTKTIAELAREIRIEGTNERLYRPAYPENQAVKPIQAVAVSATTSIAQNDAILNTPQYKKFYPSPISMPPIPPSTSSTMPPSNTVKSLADGQSTFRMTQVPKSSKPAPASQTKLHQQSSVPRMRVNPQTPQVTHDVPSLPNSQNPSHPPSVVKVENPNPESNSSEIKPKSANLANLNIPMETLRVLNLLQGKIKAQMQSNGQPINSAVLTNALAVAIGQLAKGSGGKGTFSGLANLLKGKNQAQLVNVLAAAVTSAKKPSGPSNANNPPVKTPAPILPKSPEMDGSHFENNGTSILESNSEVTSELSVTPLEHNEAHEPTLEESKPNMNSKDILSGTDNSNQNIRMTTTPSVVKGDTIRPSATPDAGIKASRPKAEVISEMLIKASKLTNPSPSIRAALAQLQAHAIKLGLEIPENLVKLNATNSDSGDLKRAAEGLGKQDEPKLKVQKTGDT